MAGDQTIVIKKVKKGGGHGHHGGAWKVAYADFVTAMMAFFLLMWLINTTTPEQKRGIADYFAPASLSPSTSGSGSILAGTALGEEGVKSRGATALIERMAPKPPEPSQDSETSEKSASAKEEEAESVESRKAASETAMASAMSRREQAMFKSAEMSLRQALQDMPELAELSKHVIVDQTPEGLRVQLIDQEGRPMFAPGSAEPTDRARTLIRAVARVLERLPNRVTISGHTDSAPPAPGVGSNWELSSARATSALNVLAGEGLPSDRIYQVAGKAGSEPLFPDDPYMAGNRRISIVLLREAPVLPPDHAL
ncbi:MAG: OmpA family protein [Caulobacterales bacterium]|nr:OmpA family protein [Caulobacterales bacterium]